MVDITPFVVVTADDGERREHTVVLASLVGDPAQRLDRIIAAQVDTPDKFLRFLMLLLGLGTGAIANPTANGETGGTGKWLTGSTGVFEVILDALANRPEQLDDLARLVGRIEAAGDGERLLPPGFTELWRLIEQARGTAKPAEAVAG
jgi:hypothetical protein